MNCSSVDSTDSVYVMCVFGKKKVKKNYPCNWPWRPIGLLDVKDPIFSGQSAHGWFRLSAALYPQKCLLVLILVRG
jgi:hypothetical protein